MDGGTDVGPGPVDAGYDPDTGNSFDDPVVLDDDRIFDMDPDPLVAEPAACRDPILVRVTRVIDGDTVQVSGISASLNGRVRLIGVDTPEIAHDGMPGDCYGAEAADFTGALEGHVVWLTFDRECTDRYDRLLAYVWVGPGPQDLWERQLLRRGFGWQTTFWPNDAHEDVLQQDELLAERDGAGLWSVCR